MSHKLLNSVWLGTVLLLVVAWSVFLGIDIANNDVRGIIVDAVMLPFWLFLVVFVMAMLIKEARLDVELEHSTKELKKLTDELLEKALGSGAEELHKRVLDDKLEEISVDILGEGFDPKKDLPTEAQLKKIATEFEKETNHKVDLHIAGSEVHAKINMRHNDK